MAKKKYEVGYGKPPVHTRFKKGASGNPAGRPKRRMTPEQIRTALEKAVSSPITVTENGSVRRIPKLQALMTQMVNKGLKGHQPTASYIVGLLLRFADAAAADVFEAGATPEDSIAEIDGILDEIRRNMSASSDMPAPENDSTSASDGSDADVPVANRTEPKKD